MSEMNKIDIDDLENVAGGATRYVANPKVGYANVRETPGLYSRVMFKISNGGEVYTTGIKVKKDGYVWYQIKCNEHPGGWIAGSLIGY